MYTGDYWRWDCASRSFVLRSGAIGGILEVVAVAASISSLFILTTHSSDLMMKICVNIKIRLEQLT